ncbi:MAG: DUF952 domain-containing protein [Acetobacteraceae bacterium]
MDEVLHVTTEADWAEAQRTGAYPHPTGGFIHLCTEGQLPFVLERHFPGRTGLLVLHLDPAGLDVRFEHSEPGMPPFPHLYGPLPAASVRAVQPAR